MHAVMAEMLWNPTLEPEDLITEFLDGYYADAGPFIRRYMDIMHDSVANVSYYMGEGT